MSESAPLTMTVDEICRDFQICRQTVGRLERAGKIPKPYRFGKRLRFPRVATMRALERLRSEAV